MIKYPKHIDKLYYPPICDFKKLALDRVNKDRPIFDLNQAVPDYAPPEKIKNAIVDHMDAPSYPFYTQDEGLDSFRGVITDELRTLYDHGASKEQLCVVAGANNGFYSTLSTLTQAGDEVILLSPYYFNHYMTAVINEVKPVEVVLDLEKGLEVNIGDIEKKITSKTRAIVFVNPNNPTGKSYPQEVVDELFCLCKKHKIVLISDEVYNYFHDYYPRPASVMNIKNFETNAVSIHSYSKTFSLTGFRVGFVAASKEFIHNFVKIHDSNIICAPRVAQVAAETGLLKSKGWLEDKVKLMKERELKFVESFSKKSSSFKIVSSGAFFVYLHFSGFDIGAHEMCLKFVEKENIIMLPASFFGPGQDRSIRLALGKVSLDDIDLLTNKIHAFSV